MTDRASQRPAAAGFDGPWDGAGRTLRLAAAPPCLALAASAALWPGGPAAAICSSAGPAFVHDMGCMYLVMGLLHVPPWLDLLRRHQERARATRAA